MKKEINIFKYLILIILIIILLFPYEYESRTITTQRSIITPTTIPPASISKSASTNTINTPTTATTNSNQETTNLKKSQSAPELIDKSSNDFIDGLFPKRQFDLRISADHDQQVGTDVVAEAIAKLWRSKSGNTQIEGTAKIAHHTGPFSAQGNTRYSGSLNVHHENF